jgi:hypothetical protein
MIGERDDVDMRTLWHASRETSLNILMRSKEENDTSCRITVDGFGRNWSISDCVECTGMTKSVPPIRNCNECRIGHTTVEFYCKLKVQYRRTIVRNV